MNEKEIKYGELSDLNLKTLIVLLRTAQSVHKRESKTIKDGGLTVSQVGTYKFMMAWRVATE